MTARIEEVRAGWTKFWFEPQPTSSLALFRIGFGLVCMWWLVTLIPNLEAFFGPTGVLPAAPDGPRGSWGVLDLWNSAVAVALLFVVTLSAAAALTVGLGTRVAAFVLWIGIVSFEQRNGLVLNSGDALLRNLAFFCVLAPSGESLSMDRLRKAPRQFWEFPARAPWALRLIQCQISIGYLAAVWHKSGGAGWRDGTAVSYALRVQDLQRFPVPEWVTHTVTVTELLTYGTLATELAIAILVWNRAARPWVLALGVLLHVSIDLTIMVGFFSAAMLAAYLSFVPPETASARILTARDTVRDRWRRTRVPEDR